MAPSFKKDPEEFKGRKLIAENVFDLLQKDDDCFIYEDIFSQIDTKALEEKYSMIGHVRLSSQTDYCHTYLCLQPGDIQFKRD